MEAMNINKINWFEKQLQHKTGVETLKLSYVSDEYMLTMKDFFVLESYDSDKPACCNVSIGSDALYFANIEQGNHYRLQVDGKVVIFKIATRKIWFFDSVDALMVDVVKKTKN